MGPEAHEWASEETSEERRRELSTTGYCESGAFFDLNESLLSRAGATWSHVTPFLERRRRPGFARACEAALRLGTFARLRTGYHDALCQAEAPAWGWKDPRNSLTLPLWHRLFPEARVVHVRRDTEAVVESLVRRAREWREAPPPVPVAWSARRLGASLLRPGAAARAVGRRLGLAAGPPREDPCLDPDYCRELCRQYVAECLRYRELELPYLELRYEEVRADPARAAARLAEFAECSGAPNVVRRAARLVWETRR